MAEDNKQGGAQNKLGELFVDFKTSGLGKLVGGLTKISGQFMLAKMGANTLANTLIKPAQQAGNTAVQIGKMSNALGTSYKEYQKLQMYLKSKNVSESLLGDVAQLEKTFYDFHNGLAGLPGELSTAFGEIGLNVGDYFGDYNSILKLLDDVQARTQYMNKEQRNQIFRLLGMSSEWGYLWDRGGFNLRDSAAISDEAIEKNIQAEEAMAQLKISTDNLIMELTGRIAPALTTIADWITKRNQTPKETADNIEKGTKQVIQAAPLLMNPIKSGKFGIELGKKIIKNQLTGGAAPFDFTKENYDNMVTPLSGGVKGNLSHLTPPTPLNASSINNTITIENNNKIYTNDAQQAADKISQLTSADVEYTQYQAFNLAGL